MEKIERVPKFELEVYRQFIRDAAAFVSLVAGRRIHTADAELMTNEQMIQIALLIDERVESLEKDRQRS